MRDRMIMTPGPTHVDESVRRAMSVKITNPDIDYEFYEDYREVCENLQKLMNTENRVYILDGEGILGLEAACASLIESGDKVLCIDNGIFGKGFGGFATMYGGEVTYFKSDYRSGVDLEALESFLEESDDYKIATLVHCETPSGILNPIDQICPLLKKHGILSIVDCVSSIGAENIEVDKWNIDIALGGSQKCISAPPGLTFLSISPEAWNRMKDRKEPIRGFYANLTIWEGWYEKKWFPYTQPISSIYGLKKAVENILENKDIIEKHSRIAEAVRTSVEESGLVLYPEDSYSNAVTTFLIPEGIRYEDIYNSLLDRGIMIAGSFDYLEDKVIRIGHMGENCYEEKVYITLKELGGVLGNLGFKLKKDMHRVFSEVL